MIIIYSKYPKIYLDLKKIIFKITQLNPVIRVIRLY